MSKCNEDTKYDRTLLWGAKGVAEYIGYAPITVRRWSKRHGLPLCKLPDGRLISSTQLVDDWFMARWRIQNGHSSNEIEQ